MDLITNTKSASSCEQFIYALGIIVFTFKPHGVELNLIFFLIQRSILLVMSHVS